MRASVKRRLRTRVIYRINYIEGDGRNWLFKVACQSGSYIRKLCYDIGEVLGGGAHMQELRRVRSGPFTEVDLVTMYDLSEAVDALKDEGDEKLLRVIIRPVEDALVLLPAIWVRDSAVDALCHGASLTMPGILKLSENIEKGDTISVFTQKGEVIALMKAGTSTEQVLELEHGVAARPLRVLMHRGIYPRTW